MVFTPRLLAPIISLSSCFIMPFMVLYYEIICVSWINVHELMKVIKHITNLVQIYIYIYISVLNMIYGNMWIMSSNSNVKSEMWLLLFFCTHQYDLRWLSNTNLWMSLHLFFVSHWDKILFQFFRLGAIQYIKALHFAIVDYILLLTCALRDDNNLFVHSGHPSHGLISLTFIF